MPILNFYVKDLISNYKGIKGLELLNLWGKTINYLRIYMKPIAARTKEFSEIDVTMCPDYCNPSLLDTDIVVYVVPDVKFSVIKQNGGTVIKAESNDTLIGLTDVDQGICEIYYNRIFDGNPQVVAGAALHEAAHLKSKLDDTMHKDQTGFFAAKPDYYGSPSESDNDFFASHIARKVNQVWRRIPNKLMS